MVKRLDDNPVNLATMIFENVSPIGLSANFAKWTALAIFFACVSALSTNTADASWGRRTSNSAEKGVKGTLFSCRAFPNQRQDLTQYGFLDSKTLEGVIYLANGMSVELERPSPNVLSYRIRRGRRTIAQGGFKSAVIQYATTAGGPSGIELHCTTSKE